MAGDGHERSCRIEGRAGEVALDGHQRDTLQPGEIAGECQKDGAAFVRRCVARWLARQLPQDECDLLEQVFLALGGAQRAIEQPRLGCLDRSGPVAENGDELLGPGKDGDKRQQEEQGRPEAEPGGNGHGGGQLPSMAGLRQVT